MTHSTIIGLLITHLMVLSSAFSFDCPATNKKGNIFLNPEPLKSSKVFSNFSDAPYCTYPGSFCPDPNYCNIQLRNAPVSNMVPCCVKLTNGESVCQCVIAVSDKYNYNKCPPPNLPLVSNQIYNMSGISRFFGIEVPICGSLHNSWNIYKGSGPEQKNTANPFIQTNGTTVNKVGFQFSTAKNIGPYYIVYYTEFVITCKTDPLFISDDLFLCHQKVCNTEKPFVNILMDISGTDLDDPNNPVFKKLDNQQTCDAVVSANDQCPAQTPGSCNATTEPCCYTNKCMFRFSSKNDTCPCPPLNSHLVMANDMILACNADNRIYLFDNIDPPSPQVFVWDLDTDGLNGELLVGRGTLKSTEAKGEDTIDWFAEFRFDPSVFSGCLTESLANLDGSKVPSFLKTLKF